MRTLKEFVEMEIKKRNLSITEFARQAGIAKTTINNILNDRGGYPHISTLISLANYTGASVQSLFSLVVGIDTVRAEAYILAQRIVDLPPDKQQLLFDLLNGVAFQQANGGSQ